MRVLVVDDHPVVLAGLRALVEAEPEMELVGTAGSIAEVGALDDATEPDVAVLDLQLPDGDGIALGGQVVARWPACRVLVLTMSSDPGAVIRALGAGLHGYVLKDSDPRELLAAMWSVADGSTVLGRGASAPVVAAAATLPGASPLSALNARDREILALLVRGLSTSQVARELFLSPKTIRNRTSEMLGKLGVDTKDEAIVLGIAGGLGAP